MPDMATKKTPRDVNVIFRCSEHERQTFHEAAERVGISMSDWLRMVALKEARRLKKQDDD